MVTTLFSGSALCGIDEKGRIRLPSFVTRWLGESEDFSNLFVGRHERDNCLIGYGKSLAPLIHADLERRRIAEEAVAPDVHHSRARRAFGLAQQVDVGTDKRLALPPFARRRAGIERFALLVGAGPVFEIWDPDQALAANDPDLRELAAWHLEIQNAA